MGIKSELMDETEEFIVEQVEEIEERENYEFSGDVEGQEYTLIYEEEVDQKKEGTKVKDESLSESYRDKMKRR